MPKSITEQEILQRCEKITGQKCLNTQQTYDEIFDSEHNPQRLDTFINGIVKDYNVDLKHYIFGDRTPAATVMLFERFYSDPEPIL